MAYIIQNGESGYSRADFESALEGKQNVLQSGVNIKTVDGKSVLGSGNIEITEREYTYELNDLEKGIKNDAINKLNLYNSNHKYLAFGFVTDLHTFLVDDGNGGVVNTYASAYPHDDCRRTLKVLGSIAYEWGLDAVLCGGDLCDGKRNNGDGGLAIYEDGLEDIESFFDQFIPCPYFFTDGNHERKYGENSELMINERWMYWLNRLNHPKNLSVTFIKDVDVFDKNGNLIEESKTPLAYFVDFDAYKVRIIAESAYEKENISSITNGISFGSYKSSIMAALQFPKSAGQFTKDPNDWVVGMFIHDKSNDTEKSRRANFLARFLTGEGVTSSGSGTDYHTFAPINYTGTLENPTLVKGKGVFGEITGHQHPFTERTLISISNYSNQSSRLAQLDSVMPNGGTTSYPSSSFNADYQNYCFSIFIVDTDQMKLHELEFGRWATVNDYETHHVTDIAQPIPQNAS